MKVFMKYSVLPRGIRSDWDVVEGTEYGPKVIYSLLYRLWPCRDRGLGTTQTHSLSDFSCTNMDRLFKVGSGWNHWNSEFARVASDF